MLMHLHICMHAAYGSHYMEHIMWQHAMYCWLQFKLAICWGPHILDQHIAVNIRFLLTIFTEDAGNSFLQLTGTCHMLQTCCS